MFARMDPPLRPQMQKEGFPVMMLLLLSVSICIKVIDINLTCCVNCRLIVRLEG